VLNLHHRRRWRALLRDDITNAVAVPGHAAGPMVVDQSLSDESDFLPALRAGQCMIGLASAQHRPRSVLDSTQEG